MATTQLTPTQKHLLRAFSFDHSEENAKEIQTVLSDYFQKKVEEEGERLWDEGILNQEVLDRLRHEDFHAQKRV